MAKYKNVALPDSEIVEVVMKKKMTYAAYKKLIPQVKKGWSIQAYQEYFFNEGTKKSIENE